MHGEAARRARAMDGPSEWRPGICQKPRIKCVDCSNRSLIPVSDAVIYSHLAGERTIGVYPLLAELLNVEPAPNEGQLDRLRALLE